jgi:hypothetical protein
MSLWEIFWERLRKDHQKETANNALHDVVFRFHSGVFFFQNIIRFQEMRKNVISFPLIKKYSLPWADFYKNNEHKQHYMQICYSNFHARQ